ncbi:MAG: Hybrid sensor histidine kinase/response regulator [Pedosphaera sp.]|nr:Hybrid sensor histidine kinase/response regulator [Pedosphaera sp.]
MDNHNPKKNLRILVIDDNRAIHSDFRKILCAGQESGSKLEAAEAALFGEPAAAEERMHFEIDSAYQGPEGLALVQQAVQDGRPYAMAFVDVRMPPGWDGIETTARIWEAYPDLQVVICTAYSDYSWSGMVGKLGNSDRLLILKKPFDAVEVIQLANALTEKWRLLQAARSRMDLLEVMLQDRTKDLQKTNASLQAEIRERERAAEALRESEERYQLLFRKNPLPMWAFDLNTLAFLEVNETAVEEYGYSAQEFLTMTLKDIRPPEEIPNLLKALGEAPLPPPHSLLAKHRRKDGTIIDVEINSRELLFSGREARLVLANNVSERKLAEERIHEQATLLDLAHDAIFVQDLEGRIQFWNKGAERLYGWTAREAAGTSIVQLLSPDGGASSRAAEKVLLEQGEWSGELRKRTKGGQEVIVDSRWTLLRDKLNHPRSVLVINTDVTERKRLEAQFLRSQRMEGIGTLATGMAHDLNNILAPILISAGTLRYELVAEDREMAIDRIEMSVKRGADIIQQVLTFGRGVSGERVAVNPADLMEDLSKIIGQTFPKNIALAESINAKLWPIIGDKTQIHQVLLNLSINARDVMPNGGELSLLAKNVLVNEAFAARHAPLQPGPYVELQIKDTGCGIPSADLERIFDPFFTTKEFGKGTGLGLSTVLGIVKSHHGIVLVESELKRGSTFKVLLPASPEVVESVKPGIVSTLTRGEGQVILIVDDEVNIVSATQRMLEQYGYKVLVANSGQEALRIFTRHDQPIELVITDIMMPGMDGLALIQALKKIDPRIKILPSSGLGKDLGGNLRAAELESLGVRCFLAKPYTAEKLLTGLHLALTEPQHLQRAELAAPRGISGRAEQEIHV